jgi:hypothetical protein
MLNIICNCGITIFLKNSIGFNILDAAMCDINNPQQMIQSVQAPLANLTSGERKTNFEQVLQEEEQVHIIRHQHHPKNKSFLVSLEQQRPFQQIRV